MDASYKIQRGIHVHLIQFFMCPEFWVHITFGARRFFSYFILCAADAGCCRGVQQRGLRQQLHAVGRLRVARGEPKVRKRGA